MQIVVVADVHGNDAALWQVLEAEHATHIFCLGDGVREYEMVAQATPERQFHIVCGNCDWSQKYPEIGFETLFGKQILFLHGHTKSVKTTLAPSLALARERQAVLLLFGHTHRALVEEYDGILACNPGSLGKNGTYLVLSWDSEDGPIVAEQKGV